MTLLLEPMITRLRKQADLRSTLNQAVGDVVALHGAEFGDIQMLMPDESLVLVGHAGLTRGFLESFARVPGDGTTVCARAVRAGRVVIVEDVTRDPLFTPYLEGMRSAPFRSVLSAPLCTTAGTTVGVVSAHFAQPYRPTPVEVASLEVYCRQLADRIGTLLAGADLETTAAALAAGMFATF